MKHDRIRYTGETSKKTLFEPYIYSFWLLVFHFHSRKSRSTKEKGLQPPLSSRQQLEIQVRDLLLDLLQLSEGFEAFLDFRPQFSGHRNLPQATSPKAD
jgi:hypothetical protein